MDFLVRRNNAGQFLPRETQGAGDIPRSFRYFRFGQVRPERFLPGRGNLRQCLGRHGCQNEQTLVALPHPVDNAAGLGPGGGEWRISVASGTHAVRIIQYNGKDRPLLQAAAEHGARQAFNNRSGESQHQEQDDQGAKQQKQKFPESQGPGALQVMAPDEDHGAEVDGGDPLAMKQVHDQRYGDRCESKQHQRVQKGHSTSSTWVH